ncbi:Glia-derived nexin [Armadillidium nasatum]|uniref:Glia-derived nexin n=1 Tax=Armadillidium nasatum TaxID=96803 RepID=A0A5N5SR39_9CRUS|nr:Glia-derived nexin [Armadillidium nasatum]
MNFKTKNNATFFVLVAYLFSFLSLSHSQCLTDNDDLTTAVDTNLQSIQEFNLELFRRVFPKDPTKNFVFSPYSVWNALVLAYFGSAGKTQLQFEKVLRLHDKTSTLRKWRQLEYMYLKRESTSVSNIFVLSNKAYFDSRIKLRTCLEGILHNEIEELELINDPAGSADKINEFVNNMTRGNIKQLVNPMDVMFAFLILVNAAYFKGTWKATFDKEKTRDLPFKTFIGTTVDVPMMSQSGRFNYGFSDEGGFEMLELPYVGETISMYIFLPYKDTTENFYGMIDSFTAENLDTKIGKMQHTRMQVILPKFRIDTVLEDELLQAIYKMGLVDAFISYKANFTDFTYSRRVKLDKSIHKAFITVDEEGTEAAAATAFIVSKIGGNSMFVCDRPFVFMIRDNETKNILFTGAFQMPDTDGGNLPTSESSILDKLIPGVKGR